MRLVLFLTALMALSPLTGCLEEGVIDVNNLICEPVETGRASDDTPVSLLAMAQDATPSGFWKWVDSTLEKLG